MWSFGVLLFNNDLQDNLNTEGLAKLGLWNGDSLRHALQVGNKCGANLLWKLKLLQPKAEDRPANMRETLGHKLLEPGEELKNGSSNGKQVGKRRSSMVTPSCLLQRWN